MKQTIKMLKEESRQIRKDIIDMFYKAGGGHFGGSLSSVDLITVLYFHELKIDVQNPDWLDRDRFILSKGHACATLCSVLSRRGYFPPSLLSTFNKLDSPFGMHPDMHKIRGCDMSTGSLGHGLPVGVGMALAGKMDNKTYRVFVMLGDGELQEGSVWEAAMSARHYNLNNLIAIIDRNMIELDGETEKIMGINPLIDKWQAFGWAVREVNGHDIKEILDTFNDLPFNKNRPSLIIANTIKGKGVSFIENTHDWHYSKMTKEQYEKSMVEIESKEA